MKNLISEVGEQVFTNILGDHSLYLISVLACNDQKIMELNYDFRGKKEVTNILSWPNHFCTSPAAGSLPTYPPKSKYLNNVTELGDIAISYQQCLQESKDLEKDFLHHLTHLIIHSCLHLLGYDHDNDLNAKLMESVEVKLLARNGLENPY